MSTIPIDNSHAQLAKPSLPMHGPSYALCGGSATGNVVLRLQYMERSNALFISLALGAISFGANAQCGPYKWHAVWPSEMGRASVNLGECGSGITSCEWDNGSTDNTVDLPVGSHSVTLYQGTTPINVYPFEIEQVAWELTPLVYGPQMGVVVETYVQLEYCPELIFDNLACRPVTDSTSLYLLQDGIAIDSISPIDCFGGNFSWDQLPFGHVYQTYLLDRSQCGSYMYTGETQTYTSDGAEMIITTQPASSGDNGGILVSEVVPDPGSLMPPPTPFTGSFTLFTSDMEWVADAPSGTSAEWTGLAPGDYFIIFFPDSLCAPLDASVTVDNATSLADPGKADRFAPRPQPAVADLYWSALPAARFSVRDAQGRILLQGQDRGQLDVSALPSGLYFLVVDAGQDSWRARFVKN